MHIFHFCYCSFTNVSQMLKVKSLTANCFFFYWSHLCLSLSITQVVTISWGQKNQDDPRFFSSHIEHLMHFQSVPLIFWAVYMYVHTYETLIWHRTNTGLGITQSSFLPSPQYWTLSHFGFGTTDQRLRQYFIRSFSVKAIGGNMSVTLLLS